MDIWHTCEPQKIATEGWLAKVGPRARSEQRERADAMSFGRGLPRALAAPGVPATSVGDLDNYGLMTAPSRCRAAAGRPQLFKRMYTPAIGTGLVLDYLAQTGTGVLTGADMLKEAPAIYTSTVTIPGQPHRKSLRDVARVHTAGLGTRIFYTQHGGYDYHAHEVPTTPACSASSPVAGRVQQDLREHHAADNVDDPGLHRVRAADEGQRQRHGSRLGRRRLHPPPRTR